MKLNDKQQQALDLGRHVSLTAGAGTGKTRVLVERYLSIIRDGRAGIANILALTFTEKAAAEMKLRVRRAMADIIREQGSGDATRAWEDRIEAFRNPCISTFHSFCAGLLREFPIEAGVDPAFDVLDEAGALQVQQEALDVFLEQRDRGGDPALRTLSGLWSRARVRAALGALLGKRFPAAQWCAGAAELSPGEMEERFRNLSEQFTAGAATPETWAGFLAQLGEHSCWHSGDKLAPVVDDAKNALENLASGAAQDLTLLLNIRLNVGSKKNWDDLPSLKSILSRCRDLARETVEFQCGARDAFAAAAAVALAQLYAAFAQHYEACKGGGLSLDFDDLEQRTLTLLRGRADIRATLRARFRYILIDEFQDTNDVQWEIIQSIAGRDRGALLDSNTFIVGDEKQSIYAFRGANVAVFDRARKNICDTNLGAAPGGASGAIEMDTCYRSHPDLIRFFNVVFKHIFGAQPEETYLAPIQYFPILAGRDEPAGGAARVELLLHDAQRARAPGEPEGNQAEADAVARRIAALASDGMPYGDMAVLFASRTRLNDYKQALRARGVPFRAVGGFGFFECPEVLDLISIIKFLAHPGDNVSLLAALRSPHFGFRDEDLLAVSAEPGRCLWNRLESAAKNPAVPGNKRMAAAHADLARWRAAAGRVPLGELLRAVCRDTGIHGVLGAAEHPAQARLNVEKLLDMARAYESRYDAGVHGFAAWLETLIGTGAREAEAAVIEQDRDAVQLMTVHASKGLEFPVVIVPEMGHRKRTGTGDSVLLDEVQPGVFEAGFTVPDPDQGFEHGPSAVRNMLKRVTRRKEEEECKRLLYVACTRAAERLILAGVRRDILDGADEAEAPNPLCWDELVAWALAREGDPAGAGALVVQDVAAEQPEDSAAAALRTAGFGDPAMQDDGAAGYRDPALQEASVRERVAALRRGKETPPDRTAVPAAGPHGRLKYLAPLERDARDTIPFSVTEILSYLDDPEDYARRRVAGVPVDWDMARAGVGKPGATPRETVPPLVRGTIIHGVFEGLPRTAPGAEAALVEELLESNGVRDADAVRDFVAHYAPRVSAFRNTPAGRAAADPAALRELPFLLSAGGWFVRGVIDALYPHQGLWHILDYKTDRVTEKDIADRENHYKLQVELYALAVLDSLPGEDCAAAGLYFVEPGAFGATYTIHRSEAGAIRDRLADVLSRMEALHRSLESGEDC